MKNSKIKYIIISLVPLLVFLAFRYSTDLSYYKSLINPFISMSSFITGSNIWYPKDLKEDAEVSDIKVEITAKSALFVEINSGEVLYQKNAFGKRRIASLTKVMTSIITLENKELGDILTVSERATDVVPDKMYIKAGEKFTVYELLEGLFLVSANDAAEVLAEGVLNNRNEFIKSMNKKALELGMNNTLFINPSGLEEDEGASDSGKLRDQYSTAIDVLLMSRYAIKKWPFLTEDITSKINIDIPATDTHRAYSLETGINLVPTNPEVKGFKIGYTPEAGLTLVTYAVKGDKEVIGVLLDSTKRRDDARTLLDYSFNKLDTN